MYFISQYGKLRVILQHEAVERLADGSVRPTSPGIAAQFQSEGIFPWAEDAARSQLTFKGTATYEGSERPIDPVPSRVGSYDTTKIRDAEMRSKIEKLMLSHPDFGRDFILVEKPSLTPPWPKYDSAKGGGAGRTTAKVIAEKVTEDGHDVAAVIAYERDNQNREEVIAALEALSVVEEEELVAA